MIKLSSDKEYSGVRIVLLTIAILVVIFNFLPEDLARALVKEHGLIEMLTAIAYGIGAAWLVLLPLSQKGRKSVSAGVMVLLLGLRELDFHAKFTTMGIFKTRYYISPEVPIVEKTIVSILVVILLIVVIRFIQLNAVSFLKNLRKREISAVCVALGIGFMVMSKLLDGMAEPLRPLVALYHSNPPVSMHVTEELMELAIPLFFILAAYHLSRQKWPRQEGSRS